MVAQVRTGTPGHIDALATGLQHFLRAHLPETLKPGDVLICNNCYELSGHLYNFTIITPVFATDWSPISGPPAMSSTLGASV